MYWEDPTTGKYYADGDAALIGYGNPPSCPMGIGRGQIPMVCTMSLPDGVEVSKNSLAQDQEAQRASNS
jgi:hypothetical protein